MSIEIRLPDIGDDQVEVTEILVKVGDSVEAEQSILTVEGDKASMEIPSPAAGVVASILVKLGDKVATNLPIMTFTTAGSATVAPQTSQAATTTESPVQAAATEQHFTIPDIGSDEVEVTELLVKVGDVVEKEQSILTVEGDKASIEVPAPAAGKVSAFALKVGDKVTTGSPMFSLLIEGVSTPVAAAAPVSNVAPAMPEQGASVVKTASTTTHAESQFVANDAYAHATPSVRSLARELGIDLSKITATGPKKRILRVDIQNYVKQLIKQNASGAVNSGGALSGLLPWPKVDFSKFGAIETVELGKIQKISGANLHRNWVMIPHVTQFDEVDITELELFRKQQNVEAEKAKLGVKITPVVFILKAVAKALEKFPRFNSSLSEDAQSLIMKKYINVGLAVDTPNGLVVPVFRDVNKKGIIELSRELSEISQKARSGKLTSSDMQGGCFTISSLGGIGGTAFTPIVNAPEVAILGVSKSATKPIWNGKEFAPRLMLPLSLSYDHRVIDGADGARFITYLNNLIADIRRLAM